MQRILVVERRNKNRQALCAALADFDVVASSDSAALERANAGRLAAIVANAALADEPDGILSLAGVVPVVLVADSASVAHAVDCMRRGAADYLVQPLAKHELAGAVWRVVDSAPPAHFGSCFSPMIGSCPAMLRLFASIETAAALETPVLIHGESGTGKELAARALHAAGKRRDAPLIAFNCATLPEALVEAELFGREGDSVAGGSRRGLLDAADGGTLFLKSIGDLSMPAQTRLLRYLEKDQLEKDQLEKDRLEKDQLEEDRLEEGRLAQGVESKRCNVRLVAATQRELQQLADNGQFLAALLERLRATVLHLPPLRQRGSDIDAIAAAVLKRAAGRLNKPGLRFAAGVVEAMQRYAWPGNVRELENAVERAVILCPGSVIDTDLLAIDVGRAAPAGAAAAEAERSGSLESYFIRFVLENQDQLTETELASELGISRKSLWERRQRLNIPRRATRKRGPRRASS